jgi:uncharacterized membrane protein
MKPHPTRRLVTFRPRDTLDRLFAVTVAIKGLDGLLELIGGLVLLVITPEHIERIASVFARSVLSTALPDTVATWASAGAERLTTGGLAFGAAYLLAHGLVKVVLVLALLRDKLWAYPWMIAVLAFFVAFQAYEFTVSPSYGLALLTVFDLVVISLTWREYRRQRQHRLPQPPPSDRRSAQVGLRVGAPS